MNGAARVDRSRGNEGAVLLDRAARERDVTLGANSVTTIIPELESDETALEMDAAPRALLKAIPRPEFGLTPIGSDQGDIPSAIDPPSGCRV